MFSDVIIVESVILLLVSVSCAKAKELKEMKITKLNEIVNIFFSSFYILSKYFVLNMTKL